MPDRRWRRLVALALAGLASSACSWFTAFVEQPKLGPWAIVGDTLTPSRGQPQFSVPITGTDVAAFQVSYTPLPGVVDSMSALRNPTPPDTASLVNGRKLFQINCAVCHGVAGAGDGAAVRFGIPAPSLLTDDAKGRSDGYIYGMIRNGRGAMPSYNRIEDMERWDIINYVRGLQGKLASRVPTGPVGYPGETGASLPRATITAPTRPAPYYRGGTTILDSTLVIRSQVPGPAPAPPPAPPPAGAAR
jgi:mono/diheme cytochrome c family protein